MEERNMYFRERINGLKMPLNLSATLLALEKKKNPKRKREPMYRLWR